MSTSAIITVSSSHNSLRRRILSRLSRRDRAGVAHFVEEKRLDCKIRLLDDSQPLEFNVPVCNYAVFIDRYVVLGFTGADAIKISIELLTPPEFLQETDGLAQASLLKNIISLQLKAFQPPLNLGPFLEHWSN